MIEPKHKVEFRTSVAASPDETFTYFTDRFGEIWPGTMTPQVDGTDPKEPHGIGFVREMKTPAGKLIEEIVTHDRPTRIEYVVTNGEDAAIYNHLGRIDFIENASGGTDINYVITYDYRPAPLGPVSAGVMKAAWALRAKRKLRAALG